MRILFTTRDTFEDDYGITLENDTYCFSDDEDGGWDRSELFGLIGLFWAAHAFFDWQTATLLSEDDSLKFNRSSIFYTNSNSQNENITF